jgi:hypothetical protein
MTFFAYPVHIEDDPSFEILVANARRVGNWALHWQPALRRHPAVPSNMRRSSEDLVEVMGDPLVTHFEWVL